MKYHKTECRMQVGLQTTAQLVSSHFSQVNMALTHSLL